MCKGNQTNKQPHSPARQAMVSIHFSSCPAPSSPWWLAWQGMMDWHICTSTGPDPSLRSFSWDPSVSNTLLDQFWSMKPCSETWSVETTGGQSVPGLLSGLTPGDLYSGQPGCSVGSCDVIELNTWATTSCRTPCLCTQTTCAAVPFMTHGLWCNHRVCVLLTCESHKVWTDVIWKNWGALLQ